jgi:hypothetical protein
MQLKKFEGDDAKSIISKLEKDMPYILSADRRTLVHLDPVSKAPRPGLGYTYSTLFLKLLLRQENKLHDGDLLQMNILSGIIAYSEVLPSFDHLLGVTGTLSCMSVQQVIN